jgi:hypothetical protein
LTPQSLFDLPPLPPPEAMRFSGPAYDPDKDRVRLAGQIQRVYAALAAGGWWTLNELAQATGDPPASISAQIRHLRKSRFGSHRIDKRRRGSESAGLWEYRMEVRHG